MKAIKLMAIALVAASAPVANAGVEWGNGDNGFHSEIPRLELPFTDPLQIKQVSCSLYFEDRLSQNPKDRIQKNGDSWCVAFETSDWRGRPKPAWHCEKDSETMIEWASRKAKLGINCHVATKSYLDVQTFKNEFPEPNKDERYCGSHILSGAKLPLAVQLLHNRKLRHVSPHFPESEAEWLFSLVKEKETENRVLLKNIEDSGIRRYLFPALAADLNDDPNLLRLFGSVSRQDRNLFRLSIESKKLSITLHNNNSEIFFDLVRCHEDTKAILEPWQERKSFPLSVKLSSSDQAILNDFGTMLNTLSLKTIIQKQSNAEFIHYRARNIQILSELHSWTESLRAALPSDSSRDLTYALYWNTAASLQATEERVKSLYEYPKTLGYCDAKLWATTSYSDCEIMDQLISKLQDRIHRLQFAFPTPTAPYDPQGCRYVTDIAETLRDLHNQFLIFDDFPLELYGSEYEKKILEVMTTLNNLRYRKSKPGEFIESILPRWRQVCESERSEIEEVLGTFKLGVNQ